MIRLTDYSTDAQALLARALQKSRIKALVGAFGSAAQKLENAAWEAVDETTLAGAVGAQLSRIGQLLREPRGTLTIDAQYRALLRGKIRIMRAHGQAGDILDALRLCLGSVLGITWGEAYPAGFTIAVSGFSSAIPHTRIGPLLALGRPAGVRMWYQWQSGATQFLLVSEAVGDDSPNSNGLSSVLGYAGGKLDSVGAY